MKTIISTTFEDKYLFFMPIVTWCWNKLGVDVICFMPKDVDEVTSEKIHLMLKYMDWPPPISMLFFDSPKHKEATYAQCSRLYASAMNELSEDEILITSDIDMILFQVPARKHGELPMSIFGSDLVPSKQFPMCYASATVKDWREIMKINGRTYQQCLDDLLGNVEAEHFRGNYWSKDQETLWENACDVASLTPRTNGHTPFATKRYDRDDAFLLERLNPDTIDYHLPRPGYEENNFNQILTVLNYHYPNDDLGWMREYRDKYVDLL